MSKLSLLFFSLIGIAAAQITCAANEVQVEATQMCTMYDPVGINTIPEPTVVGCVSSDLVCTAVESYAVRNSDQATFRFQGCIPSGFTTVQAPHEVTAHHKAAFCENAASNVVVGCVAADTMCAQVVTFASLNDEIFVFDDSCIPEGFTVLPSESCESTGITCTGQVAVLATRVCSDAAVSEVVGCRDEEAMCPEIVVTAVDEHGTLWQFNDGCLPAGFTPSQASCPIACAANEVQVEATQMCTMYDPVGINTIPEPTVVGCVSSDLVCTAVESYAVRNSDQATFRFQGCIPSGFTTVQAPHEVTAHHKAAFCENAASNVVVGCVAADTMCAQVVTFASLNDEIFVFDDSCVPEGFTVLPSESCQSTGIVCAANEVQVEATQMCTMYDPVGINTIPEPTVVGCVSSDLVCTAVESYAVRNSDQATFRFQGCVPSGFTTVQAPHEVTAHHKAAFCENAASNVVVGCVAADAVCAQVVTFASLNDQIFVFDDSCVPEGFTVLPSETCPNRCNADQQEVVAVPIDNFCGSTGTDYPESEALFVGCVGNNIRCIMEITFGRNMETGAVYVFRQACLPEGFEVVEPSCKSHYCSVVDCAAGLTCDIQQVTCIRAPCPPIPRCINTMCVNHMDGASFAAGDGCNTCSCDFDGNLRCTKITCDTECLNRAEGEVFTPEESECSTCTCTNGVMECKEDTECKIDVASDKEGSSTSAGAVVGFVGLGVALVAGSVLFAKYLGKRSANSAPPSISNRSRSVSAPYGRVPEDA